MYICALHNFNLPKAIIPKLWKIELCFLYPAVLIIKIYLAMNFHTDTSYSFCGMLDKSMMDRQTNEWTNEQDKWTDKAVTICCPFREHNNKSTICISTEDVKQESHFMFLIEQ